MLDTGRSAVLHALVLAACMTVPAPASVDEPAWSGDVRPGDTATDTAETGGGDTGADTAETGGDTGVDSSDSGLPDTADTGAVDTADTGGDTGFAFTIVPDFALEDLNPGSVRYGQVVSPRDYLEQTSGWYFIHAT